MDKKHREKDPLTQLLAASSHQALTELVLEIVKEFPETLRKCYDFLRASVPAPESIEKQSEGEAVMAIWSKLEPDLKELNGCGGGDYTTVDYVWDLMEEIIDRLGSKNIDADYRREIIDLALPFIKSGDSGMEDQLYEVIYAACYDDEDFRKLAQDLEMIGSDWPLRNAREIYRSIGDREKYLELRNKSMTFGLDYHDLAEYYWECGEKEKALQTAEEGLRKATGRMDELREFVAARSLEAGNRERFMELQLEQALLGLTLEKYMALEKLCTPDEWEGVEIKIVRSLENTRPAAQLSILLYRKEYDKALATLLQKSQPESQWEGGYGFNAAQKLEKLYPEEILEYYVSALGDLDGGYHRGDYARKAKVMFKVRHMLIDVIGDEARWKELAGKVKHMNRRRPAFQDEFSKIIPGWRDLK